MKRYIGVLALLGVAGVVGYYVRSSPSSRPGAIALGILGSTVASVIFAVVNGLAFRSQQSDIREMKELLLGVVQRELRGVLSVGPKYEHQPEFWFNLLSNTTDRLDIAGNKLATWVNPLYKETFSDTVTRLARSGATVRLIVYDLPESATVETIPDDFKDDSAWKTYSEVVKIARHIPEHQVANIQLKTLRDKARGRYMIVATDKLLVHSGYLAARSSRDMYSTVLIPGTPHFTTLLADFDALFNMYSVEVPIKRKFNDA